MPVFAKREGVMLCYPADQSRLNRMPQKVMVQPKLNGERCKVLWYNNEPILVSSYGNEFQFLDRIKEKLKAIPTKLNWDGEIYVHGWSRERIHSALSRKKNYNPDVELLEFHVFDYLDPDHLQLFRTTAISNAFDSVMASVGSVIRPVQTKMIDKSTWIEHLDAYTALNYEGIIIRNPLGFYEEKRSTSILKYKPTEQDEYEIIGFNQEEAIDGTLKDSLGSFIVSGDDGTPFAVGTGPCLTADGRSKLWKDRESLIGKMLVVKHEKIKTVNGIPIATVAIKITERK